MDKDQALRDNIRMLGTMLGDVLSEQEGNDLLEAVERIRSLAKDARNHNAKESLLDELAGLDTNKSIHIVRAFAQFLALANIAEQHHRIRRRREYQRQGIPQRGSLEASFPALLKTGISKEDLHRTVCSLNIELVLTAHPTEVNRRTLLQKYNAIARLLYKLDYAVPSDHDDVKSAIKRLITEIWHTNELHRKKPTPLDEARAGLLIFEQQIWDAVPKFLRSLNHSLKKHTDKALPIEASPVRFGSWMGGDRDGNPNVTPETTQKTWAMARWIAAELYWKEIDALRSELSLAQGSSELMAVVGDAQEPYRVLLRTVRDRLDRTRTWAALRMKGQNIPANDVYQSIDELTEPLLLCYRSLTETGCSLIAQGRLTDILRRLYTFGLSLVRLDIRQESENHTEAMNAITQYLGLGSYTQWSEERKQAFLIRELNNARPLIPSHFPCSAEVQDVLDTFKAIAQTPSESLGAYVISMATYPSDVLLVSLFQKEFGVANPLRVVPLFETRDDLESAHKTIETLLQTPIYKGCSELEIMLGYSDSAKDAGRMAASWALYTAQERLVEVCNKHQVQLTLFHGRGGTVGRGGGPMSLAIRSQPPGSIQGSMRVTEQGEMIQAKFGLTGIAIRTLEVYTTAVSEATLAPPKPPKAEWRSAMALLANSSLAAYRGIVREHPQFVPYFRSATPEPELGQLNIGSRPARRRTGTGVESLRAIPWVFAWTQTRLLLPSWLGTGVAFSEHNGPIYQEMATDWPFFDSTLDLIAMVLAKALPDIAEQYERRLVEPELHELGRLLRGRLQKAISGLLALRNRSELLDENRTLQRSIALRNPYVDPINLLQVELLYRLRHEDLSPEAREQIGDALKMTINGIAHGMRNTG